MEILNVRALLSGYLVNGYIKVTDKDDSYELVLEWIKDGKEVMPMLSDSELQAIETAQKVQEANTFLASTDWIEPFIIAHKLGLEGYVLSADSNKLLLDAQRDEARAFVRANS